ncbi:MAG: hypothetical protein JWQ40_1531 [Segetibacter sp.]|nr:hypothetical protein [Segetibacter sp.]
MKAVKAIILFLFIANASIAQKASFKEHGTKKLPALWRQASFKILSPVYKTFKTAEFANVFLSKKNSIVKIAPEINGLTGIKGYYNGKPGFQPEPLKIHFSRPVRLLVGISRDSSNPVILNLSTLDFGKGKLQAEPVLKNAVTITGLPAIDVYVINYPKGTHAINLSKPNTQFTLLGVIDAKQTIPARDVQLPDGRLWEPFIVEGFYDEKPLFEIIGGPGKPVVDEGMPGTEGIQGGFEAGACVKVGDTYHMFPTERAGEKGVEAYFDRVKTRIGHWSSKDAINWTRQSTVYQASGTYAVTNDDNPFNDRRGAIWSFNPVFNKEKNRWYGYYLTYTVSKEISPNHSFGRMWVTESQTAGIEGIGGPYGEGKIIMEPGLDTQLWEGRQGVASFFPYPVKDHWLGFFSGAYPYLKREDYPAKMGKGWFVGLAKSKSLEGPWTRLDTTINPIKSIHPWFVENPIVYQMLNGLYLAVYDGGPEGWGHHLPNMVAYTVSKDGYHWSEAHYLPFTTKVDKWWDIMRTPMCLIDEGNDVYTIVYAAINTSKRFHPLGMIKVKLNRDVLDAKMKTLE